MKKLSNDAHILSIYCDESHPIKNDGCDFYVLGCAIINSNDYKTIDNDLTKIKEKYGYSKDYEIKWSKINGKNILLIKEIIEYCKNADIGLRILIVPNKDEHEYELLLSHEVLYSKMYYLLLEKIFLIDKYSVAGGFNLFFDRRNSYSDKNAEKLEMRLYYNTSTLFNHSSKIVDSKNEQLIQIIDLFIGATSYERLKYKTSITKLSVINFIKRTFGLSKLNFRSSINASKYNVFIWDGRYTKYGI